MKPTFLGERDLMLAPVSDSLSPVRIELCSCGLFRGEGWGEGLQRSLVSLLLNGIASGAVIFDTGL